nr:immunoglobulin light chain junction region [Macaca mulatta]
DYYCQVWDSSNYDALF